MKKNKQKYLALLILCMTSLLILFHSITFAFAKTMDDTDNGTGLAGNVGKAINSRGKPVSGDMKGTPIDSILESGMEYGDDAVALLGEFFCDALSNSFSPSWTTIFDLEKGKTLELAGMVDEEDLNYTKQDVMNTTFFSSIFSTAVIIGSAIASVLLLGNLLLCILGRSEQIKDTPIMLVVKYIVAMLMIYLSEEIIYRFIIVIYGLWSANIGVDSTQLTGFGSFHDTFGQCVDVSNGTVLNIKMTQYISNTVNGGTYWLNIICWVFGIFLIWKLVKNVFRLYVEIAERYFVLMVFSVMFPSAVATTVSNSTKNIFWSYVRFLLSQAFIMFINMAFIKIFMVVLINGGWMNGFLNYMAALAFLRVCQRLDTYLLAMGLNVAQTGGGLINSCGGAFRNVMNVLRGANDLRKNAGRAIQNAAVSSNNYSMYTAGAIVGMSAENLAKYGSPSRMNFEQELSKKFRSANVSKGEITNVGNFPNEKDNSYNLKNALNSQHLPTTLADDLQQKGINDSNAEKLQKIDNGVYSISDMDGNNLATIDRNNSIYTSTSLSEELAKRDEANQIVNENDPDTANAMLTEKGYGYSESVPESSQYLTNEQINGLSMTGANESLKSIGNTDVYRNTFEPGVQMWQTQEKYMDSSTGIYSSQSRVYKYAAYDTVSHPDMLKNVGKPNYEKVYNNGNCYVVHKQKYDTKTVNMGEKPQGRPEKPQKNKKR